MPLAKISNVLPLIIPQIACRVDYIMVNCLIDEIINILLKNMGTSRKRTSKVNKIPSKRLKQPKYVFLRFITQVHQPCLRVENKRFFFTINIFNEIFTFDSGKT